MENIQNNNELSTPKRPTFLTVLCILTFISAGSGVISSLLTPSFADVLTQIVTSYPGLDEDIKTNAIKIYQAGWPFHSTNLFLSACSLAGAMLMWNLKKIGFHFYTASNLGLLLVPTLMLEMPIGWGNVFLTASFIAMYAAHLKNME